MFIHIIWPLHLSSYYSYLFILTRTWCLTLAVICILCKFINDNITIYTYICTTNNIKRRVLPAHYRGYFNISAISFFNLFELKQNRYSFDNIKLTYFDHRIYPTWSLLMLLNICVSSCFITTHSIHWINYLYISFFYLSILPYIGSCAQPKSLHVFFNTNPYTYWFDRIV